MAVVGTPSILSSSFSLVTKVTGMAEKSREDIRSSVLWGGEISVLVQCQWLGFIACFQNLGKAKSFQQELDMEHVNNILETTKPKLKGAKYVRECYARKRLQLKRQQAQFWKLINEANDQMQDETTQLLHAWIPKEEGSPSSSILSW
jgi:hypothetical protein